MIVFLVGVFAGCVAGCVDVGQDTVIISLHHFLLLDEALWRSSGRIRIAGRPKIGYPVTKETGPMRDFKCLPLACFCSSVLYVYLQPRQMGWYCFELVSVCGPGDANC